MGYSANWMQLLLDDDSEDKCPLNPCKELTEYLESKHEDQKEGLVEWWGVSLLAYHYVFLLTDRYILAQFPLLPHPLPHCTRLSCHSRVFSCLRAHILKWSTYRNILAQSPQDRYV
jgi:hypothetical protein